MENDQIIDEIAFLKKYNFNAFVNVTVINPTSEDFTFSVTMDVGLDLATGKQRTERRTYGLRAGATERFPGVVANIYLDQMTKLMSQNDNNFGAMIDYTAKAEYYDKLIVEIDDPVNSYQAYQTVPLAEVQATASATGGDGTGGAGTVEGGEDKPFARRASTKS